MPVELFSPDHYKAANLDLAAAGITTNEQLLNHFRTFGINEGRDFSPFVNLDLYRQLNPDLQAAGLTTNQQLLDHLQTKGVAEGRRFSEIVDLEFYLEANPDVKQTVQGDREKAMQHLLNFGLAEGRRFSPVIDLKHYLEYNPDLTRAFGSDRKQALTHLKIYGVKEGRAFSPVVDLNLYKTLNPDLQRLDNSRALQHLVIYGIGETRQFSYSLDLSYYGFNNPDLLTAYARSKNLRTEAVVNNTAEVKSYYNFLLRHFEIVGSAEKRRSSAEFDAEYYRRKNPDLARFSNSLLYEHFRNFGVKEQREYSDSYDSGYYRNFNSAPNGFNRTNKELYEYYISTGVDRGDIAASNIKFTDEVIADFDLVKNSATIGGILNSRSEPNPDRPGSYADSYIVSGLDPGQQVQIEMKGSYDTYLQLIDLVTGEIIAENDNISATDLNSRINFTVDPLTDYIIRASSVDARALGAYTLTGQASATIVGNIAANGGSVSGTLRDTDLINPDGSGTLKQDYRLDLTGVNPQQKIKLNLDSSEFDAYLDVINADTKEVIASEDDASEDTTNTELYFVVEQGVNYAVRVTSFDEGEKGNFVLSSSALADPPIDRAQNISAILTPGGNPDTYDLQGASVGDRIRVNVVSEQFDTFLRIVPSNGAAIDNDDANSTLHSEVTFTVEPNTTYQFLVTRADKDKVGAGNYTITTTPLTGANSTFTLDDAGLQGIIAGKENLVRADILALFNQAKADNTINAVEQGDLKKLADNSVRFRIPNDVKFLLSKVNEALPQNANGDTLQSAVDRWFLGKVPPLPRYVGKGDTARGEAATKTTNVTHLPVQGNIFGSDAEAKIRGINQRGLGDCAFLAAVAATFANPLFEGNQNASSLTINQMIRNNGDGTYSYRFFDKGTPFYVTVNNDVATLQAGSADTVLYNRIPYAARGGAPNLGRIELGNGYFFANTDKRSFLQDDGGSIWGSLVEKAYAQFRELTADQTFKEKRGDDGGYSLIGNGDNVTDPLERVTGRKATSYGMTTTGINLFNFETQQQATFDDISNALTQGRAIEVGTSSTLPNFPANLLVGGHAYAVTRAYVEGSTQRIVVFNPWGNDGGNNPVGNVNDGFIDMSFEQFKNGFFGMAIC